MPFSSSQLHSDVAVVGAEYQRLQVEAQALKAVADEHESALVDAQDFFLKWHQIFFNERMVWRGDS
jgi:hypothetical protein